MRHKIIPDSFAYSFATLAILHLFISVNEKGITFLIPSANSMIAGVALAFPFYLLWLISDGRWMGLGDAKLALGIGWFLGLSAGLTAVIFGFWIGAAVSILLLLLSKVLRTSKKVSLLGLKVTLPRLSMKSEVPFAPFLIAGLLLVFFFGYNVTTFIL